MEFIQLQPSECPICYENDNTILCPLCHQSACKQCIIDHNTINNTNKCECPTCHHKFNKLIAYMIFGGESKTFLLSQIKKYRDIILINTSCTDFYKAFTKINKSQLELLLNIPNFQLLLSYYINILRKNKCITVESVMDRLVKRIFSPLNIQEITKSNVNRVKFNDILTTARKLILDDVLPKEWICVDKHKMNGPDCYYIKRKPVTFVKNISETKMQRINEYVELLCPPRKKYLNDIILHKKDVAFDNRKYRCSHCDTFVIDKDSLESNNSKFNIKDLMLSDDYKSFECIENTDKINSTDVYNDGYIVKRFIETLEYTVKDADAFDVLGLCGFNEKTFKYYLYVITRIGNMFNSKSKAKKIKFLNDIEELKTLINNLLVGESTSGRELCDSIIINIKRLISSNNFNERLIDELINKLLINSSNNDLVNELMQFIRCYIYGNDMEDDKINELDSLLLSSTTYDYEYDLNVFNNKTNVTYKEVFGDLSKKYNLNANVDRLSFMKCKFCDGCVIKVGDKRQCVKCEVAYCEVCNEVCGDDHKCDENVLKSIRMIENECHKCPCCGVMIYKSFGCNHMFCTNCHNSFDWASGNTISEDEQTNPLYFEWIESTLGKNGDGDEDDSDCVASYTEFDVNPYVWCIEQFKMTMNNLKCKLIEEENKLVRDLTGFMENDNIALNLIHDVNYVKCLLGFTKHCYSMFKESIRKLFNNVTNVDETKEKIRNMSMNHYNLYKKQCELFNTLFVLGINGDNKIEQSLNSFRNDYRKLYDYVKGKLEDIVVGDGDDFDLDEVLGSIKESMHENNMYKLLAINNFEEKLQNCCMLMMKDYPNIVSYDDVMKML